MVTDDLSYCNEEESEMGQLHAIHINLNAVAAVRRKLQQNSGRPSIMHCVDCGDDIPIARRNAVPGVDTCVACQSMREQH